MELNANQVSALIQGKIALDKIPAIHINLDAEPGEDMIFRDPDFADPYRLHYIGNLRYPAIYLGMRTGTTQPVFVLAHKLVALASYGPLPKGHCTRHLDGNVCNYSPANLAYGTKRDDYYDYVRRNGTDRKRITKDQKDAILAQHTLGRSRKSIADTLGVSIWHVHKVLDNKYPPNVTSYPHV